MHATGVIQIISKASVPTCSELRYVLADEEEAVLDLINGSRVDTTPEHDQRQLYAEAYTPNELRALSPKDPVSRSGPTGYTHKQAESAKSKLPWDHFAPGKYYNSVAYGRFTANPENDSDQESADKDTKLAGGTHLKKKYGDQQKPHRNAATSARHAGPAEKIYTAVVDDQNFVKDPTRPVFHRNGHETVEMEQLNNITSIREPDLYELLERLLTLVDKYSSSKQPLHTNRKFQDIALRLLSTYLTRELTSSKYTEKQKELEKQLHERDVKLKEREDMLKELQGRTSDVIEQYKLEIEKKEKKIRSQQTSISTMQTKVEKLEQQVSNSEKVKETVEIANKDMADLRERLLLIEEENKSLKAQLEECRQRERQFPHENDHLRQQLTATRETNSKLEEQCKHQQNSLSQLHDSLIQQQQLASMLQESHRSLVTTNDHLLQELDDTKQRHQHEVHQMHWTYEQLKKTCDWLPKT